MIVVLMALFENILMLQFEFAGISCLRSPPKIHLGMVRYGRLIAAELHVDLHLDILFH